MLLISISLHLSLPLSFSLISLAYCVYCDGNSWRIACNKCQLTRGVLVLSHNTAAARILRVEMRLAFCQNEKNHFMNERPPLFVGRGYKLRNWLWDQTSIVRLKLFQHYIKLSRVTVSDNDSSCVVKYSDFEIVLSQIRRNRSPNRGRKYRQSIRI